MFVHNVQGRGFRTMGRAWLICLLAWNCSPRQTAASADGTLPIVVIDEAGEPVAGVVVKPWALRSALGHGLWRPDGQGESEPPVLTTDAAGRATVPYPRYSQAAEQVRTLNVTLSVDHPDYVFISHEDVEVPRPDSSPHEIKLQRGSPIEITPLIGGKPVSPEGVYALWSDSRCWGSELRPQTTPHGQLQIPPMPPGPGQLLLVKLEDERATHFSAVIDIDLVAGETLAIDVPLEPSIAVQGVLSADVPRPVINGRVLVSTLPAVHLKYGSQVAWHNWAPVDAQGRFVIDAWPRGESIQMIGLCDGHIAQSGATPAGVNGKRYDTFHYPQVFAPAQFANRLKLTLTMEPLVRCEIGVADQRKQPLEGVAVGSYPNVLWWNGGSQIYCDSLANSAIAVANRGRFPSEIRTFPSPFLTKTDVNGRAVLELPQGEEKLFVDSDAYELPITLGRRVQKVELVAGATTQVQLTLNPKGTEHLGDWDKLTGILFGCTGEQCRRLLDDEGFREKMDAVRADMDAAVDPHDPKMLKKAFAEIADAFREIDDQEEVERWSAKSKEQEQKLLEGEDNP